jgi:hypothetical protein
MFSSLLSSLIAPCGHGTVTHTASCRWAGWKLSSSLFVPPRQLSGTPSCTDSFLPIRNLRSFPCWAPATRERERTELVHPAFLPHGRVRSSGELAGTRRDRGKQSTTSPHYPWPLIPGEWKLVPLCYLIRFCRGGKTLPLPYYVWGAFKIKW